MTTKKEKRTLGQRSADTVALVVGSWKFILIQSTILLLWAAANVILISYRWDPYPFILMNLVLSLQAAFTAPIIMMSQKRQAQKDRENAQEDLNIDQQDLLLDKESVKNIKKILKILENNQNF